MAIDGYGNTKTRHYISEGHLKKNLGLVSCPKTILIRLRFKFILWESRYRKDHM